MRIDYIIVFFSAYISGAENDLAGEAGPAGSPRDQSYCRTEIFARHASGEHVYTPGHEPINTIVA